MRTLQALRGPFQDYARLADEMAAQPLRAPAGGAGAAEGGGGPPQSPSAIVWRHLRRNRAAMLGAFILCVLYGSALFAPFVATYDPALQANDWGYAAPTRLHLRDSDGRWHAWPFVYGVRPSSRGIFQYDDETSVRYPLRFFAHGEPYTWCGLRLDRHLLGVDPPARLYLWGADISGRDIFSRLVFGGRISLSVGLVGVLVTFAIGLIAGAVAGYFGGIVDTIVMRLTELLQSIPYLYLILAIRATFPGAERLSSAQMYFIIILLLSLIGWSSLARVIRGMVLALRQNEYVIAAQALGYSTPRILLRHILPNTVSFTIVAATVAIPGLILGEVYLSYLGAGIQEPTASWGNMLDSARGVTSIMDYPWVYTPGILIFLTSMAFNFLGDGLRDALDPRRIQGK